MNYLKRIKKRKLYKKLKKTLLYRKARYIRKRSLNLRYSSLGNIDERRIVFYSNSIQTNDAAKELYRKIKSDSKYEDFKFGWVCRSFKKLNRSGEFERTHFYAPGSKKAIRAMSKARYVIFGINPPSYMKKSSRQLWICFPELYTVYEGALPELPFIDLTVGVGDGPLKSKIRRHNHLMQLFRNLNGLRYELKKQKRKAIRRLKNIARSARLKLRWVWYNFTGILRTKGLFLGTEGRRLYRYKGKHIGQRCFLIGNGPSLTVDDLGLLKNEITFGCNRIYKLFGKTNWRPTYYCMIDALIAKYDSKDLAESVSAPVFTNLTTKRLMRCLPERIICARNLGLPDYRVSHNFLSYYIPSGATVMTFMLELAVYMGFSEIYLLGVDCTSSLSSNNHCAEGYVNPELIQKDLERVRKRLNNPNLTAEEAAAYYYDKSTFSYSVIRDYIKDKPIKIYNATRGGRLEVFERKQIEEILFS